MRNFLKKCPGLEFFFKTLYYFDSSTWFFLMIVLTVVVSTIVSCFVSIIPTNFILNAINVSFYGIAITGGIYLISYIIISVRKFLRDIILSYQEAIRNKLWHASIEAQEISPMPVLTNSSIIAGGRKVLISPYSCIIDSLPGIGENNIIEKGNRIFQVTKGEFVNELIAPKELFITELFVEIGTEIYAGEVLAVYEEILK